MRSTEYPSSLEIKCQSALQYKQTWLEKFKKQLYKINILKATVKKFKSLSKNAYSPKVFIFVRGISTKFPLLECCVLAGM